VRVAVIIFPEKVNPVMMERQLKKFCENNRDWGARIINYLNSNKILFDYESMKILEPIDSLSFCNLLIWLNISEAYYLTPQGPAKLLENGLLVTDKVFFEFYELAKWFKRNWRETSLTCENAYFYYPPYPSLHSLLIPTLSRLQLNERLLKDCRLIEAVINFKLRDRGIYDVRRLTIKIQGEKTYLIYSALKIAHVGHDPREGRGAIKKCAFISHKVKKKN